jgi:large subunit ribosomal protein L4
MTVLDQFQLEQIKTKDFAGILNRFELKKTLVVLGQADVVVERSARNIPNVKVLRYEGLNVYDLLNYHSVLLTQASVGKIEESLAS